MSKFKLLIETLCSIGLINLLRIFAYKSKLKINDKLFKNSKFNLPCGFFFSNNSYQIEHRGAFPFLQEVLLFDYHKYELNDILPNWFYNPINRQYFLQVNKKWTEISDFDNEIGDIKTIWELSRFNWLLNFVIYERENKNGKALAVLDYWLNDWCEKNPAYYGPNWKCGQEASIRVMHIITGTIGLNMLENLNINLVRLIEYHLERIATTLDYALAQDNNHGTSEAVALYIGGAVLYNQNRNNRYLKWRCLGKKWLINRAQKLIMKDGGFSQYSTNYHRVMLDSCCLAEIVRRKLDLEPFPTNVYKRLATATEWLFILTQEDGDTPNLGANDGARLIPVSSSGYRDFRPTVQLASTLFNGYSFYDRAGVYDESLEYFAIKKIYNEITDRPSKSMFFEHSGLITYENENFFVCFKFPKFKFRPSQCDALHLDIWYRGKNILRDGGSYSYNTINEDLDYFSGVKSHNTIEFDGHLQMPRLGRFLFGAWLRPNDLSYNKNIFSCGYKDYWNCQHNREVIVDSQKITVIDKIQGFKDQAILRWRLIPGKWLLSENSISNGEITLEILCDNNFQIRLAEGIESIFYYKKNRLPVLEACFFEETKIITEIKVL